MKKIEGEAMLRKLKQSYTPEDKFTLSDLEFFVKVEPEIHDGEKSAWIDKYNSDKKICFVCREEADQSYKFCPHCGRDMSAILQDPEDDPNFTK